MDLHFDLLDHITKPTRDPLLLSNTAFNDILHVARRQDARSGKQLMLLGSVHDPDPKRWYYDVAKQLFNTWRTETEGQERCIVVEGLQQHNPLFATTEEASIKRCHNEVGLQNFWGNKYGIPVVPSEVPNYADILALLRAARVSDKFTVDDVLFYIGARELPVYYRMSRPKPAFAAWMQSTLDVCCQSIQQECEKQDLPCLYDISYKNFKKLHRRYLGFDPRANGAWVDPRTGLPVHQLYLRITTPFARHGQQVTPITWVSRACMDIRDRYKNQQLWGLWQKGSIWWWQGGVHSTSTGRVQEVMGEPIKLGLRWRPPVGVHTLPWVPSLGYFFSEYSPAKKVT